MFTGLHVQYRLFLSDFNQTWIFLTDFRKNPQIPNFVKIRPMGRAVPCGQTDRHTGLSITSWSVESTTAQEVNTDRMPPSHPTYYQPLRARILAVFRRVIPPKGPNHTEEDCTVLSLKSGGPSRKPNQGHPDHREFTAVLVWSTDNEFRWQGHECYHR